MDTDNSQNNIVRARVGAPAMEYDETVAIIFCERIAEGSSMRTVCKAKDMPSPSTIFKWLADTSNGFNALYAQACDARADADAEDLRDIADDGTNDYMEDNYQKGKTPGWELNGENIQRSKLRINTRQWLMAKQRPKKFGDKLDMTTNGKDLPTPILGGIAKTDTTDDIKPES